MRPSLRHTNLTQTQNTEARLNEQNGNTSKTIKELEAQIQVIVVSEVAPPPSTNQTNLMSNVCATYMDIWTCSLRSILLNGKYVTVSIRVVTLKKKRKKKVI